MSTSTHRDRTVIHASALVLVLLIPLTEGVSQAQQAASPMPAYGSQGFVAAEAPQGQPVVKQPFRYRPSTQIYNPSQRTVQTAPAPATQSYGPGQRYIQTVQPPAQNRVVPSYQYNTQQHAIPQAYAPQQMYAPQQAYAAPQQAYAPAAATGPTPVPYFQHPVQLHGGQLEHRVPPQLANGSSRFSQTALTEQLRQHGLKAPTLEELAGRRQASTHRKWHLELGLTLHGGFAYGFGAKAWDGTGALGAQIRLRYDFHGPLGVAVMFAYNFDSADATRLSGGTTSLSSAGSSAPLMAGAALTVDIPALLGLRHESLVSVCLSTAEVGVAFANFPIRNGSTSRSPNALEAESGGYVFIGMSLGVISVNK